MNPLLDPRLFALLQLLLLLLVLGVQVVQLLLPGLNLGGRKLVHRLDLLLYPRELLEMGALHVGDYLLEDDESVHGLAVALRQHTLLSVREHIELAWMQRNVDRNLVAVLVRQLLLQVEDLVLAPLQIQL